MRLFALPFQPDNRSEQAECRSRGKDPAIIYEARQDTHAQNATLLMNVFFISHSNFPGKEIIYVNI